ncbi:MAG TPA: rod shape-determining protein MreD [Acidimicrobiales bacterium]|jgi:rod shape-determining protein MreD|nr:rod shape-determining protein MreD [Acidimicrobiales bacterium]
MNAMARSRLVLVLFVAMGLQLVVASRIQLAGVHPDLMVLTAVSAGVVAGPSRAATVGFVAGLLNDLFLQTPFGLSALTFCLVAYAVATLQGGVLRAAWWVPVLTAVVATAGGEVLYALIGAIVGQGQMLTDRLGPIAGVVGGTDGILAVLAVPAVGWAFRTEGAPARSRSRW